MVANGNWVVARPPKIANGVNSGRSTRREKAGRLEALLERRLLSGTVVSLDKYRRLRGHHGPSAA